MIRVRQLPERSRESRRCGLASISDFVVPRDLLRKQYIEKHQRDCRNTQDPTRYIFAHDRYAFCIDENIAGPTETSYRASVNVRFARISISAPILRYACTAICARSHG